MIPIILGAAAIASAAFGAKKGSEGIGDMNKAKKIGECAQKRCEVAVSQLRAEEEVTNKLAKEYGQLQIDVKMRTIGRFVAFLERIGQRASESDMHFLEGLDISVQQFQEYKATVIEAQEWAKGGVSAAVAGAAAASTATTLARSVGTATVTRFFGLWATEVGISQLSGAAARSATVAWLGGGSMAVGGFVMGGIALAPALMVGGFQIAGKGEEALTKAREYEAKINTEIAKIAAAKDLLGQVERRIIEMRDLVESLSDRAVLSLNELESQPAFDKNRDASKFQQVALLVTALVEIIKTPILDSQGDLNPATTTIQAKYRTLGGN
jgi:hypothetical protein